MRATRIIWTDHEGRTRLFGSTRKDGSKMIEDARGYLGRAYSGRPEREAIVESVRAEENAEDCSAGEQERS